MNLRKSVSAAKVREYWSRSAIKAAGVSASVALNIGCDDEDSKTCWCCGRSGYQEIAHIVPHSLGGSSTPENLFLLCAECHILSPDAADPEFFYKWINGNAGRFWESFDGLLSDLAAKIERSAKGDPDAARIISEAIKRDLPKSIDDQFSRITTHGAMLSTSSLMAAGYMAASSVIGSVDIYDESAATLSATPWRFMPRESKSKGCANEQLPLV